MFKPGDEVVCVFMETEPDMVGQTFTIASIHHSGEVLFWANGMDFRLAGSAVQLVERGHTEEPSRGRWGWRADRFRKVQKRSSGLSLESFLTIKPGFEEPRRSPEKAKEKTS